MKDLTVALEDRPGALADFGEALGRAGVSVEGGGPGSWTPAALRAFLGRQVADAWSGASRHG